jgi:hypothetical protein
MRRGLDRFDVDLVMVPIDSASGQVLMSDPGWRGLYQDDSWSILCRRGATLTDQRRC